MRPRIGKLTPEQEAELPSLRERWLRTGLATKALDPINPASARRAARVRC